MAKENPDRFIPQYYMSDESKQGPYAPTPDDSRWVSDYDPVNREAANEIAREWTKVGDNKTCRIVEVDDEWKPISVVWMSVWEQPPEELAEAGVSPTLRGESIKLMVWKDRDAGPPDHWDYSVLRKALKENNNAWDLVYGREVDRRGREILWSIRMNIWVEGKKPVEQWNWLRIFGYDPEDPANRDKVEAVRAHEIPPNTFPESEPLAECSLCGKTILEKEAWKGWNNEADDMIPYCSCKCIDNHSENGTDEYRITPEGIELEEPGCVVEREKTHAA